MITVTKQQLIDMQPCYLQERLALFGSSDTISVSEALDKGATVQDICWVMGRLNRVQELVTFAKACSDRVQKFTNGYAASSAASSAADAARYAASSTAKNARMRRSTTPMKRGTTDG